MIEMDEKRLESIIEDIGTESFQCSEPELTDVKWLISKLVEVSKELKTANIYSSTVAKELEDLRIKHQRADEQISACLKKNEELKKKIESIKQEWDDAVTDLIEAQIKIDQLEGNA